MNAPYYADDRVTVWNGDSLDVLKAIPDSSVDSVCTDPPYGLSDLNTNVVTAAVTAWVTGDREHVPGGRGFMGRSWDRFVPPPALWDEVLRVLKPGGHLLAFAAPRTQDLMGLSIRLAGFEIRPDCLTWLHAQGFPKSLDVSKAIDRAAGADRAIAGAGRWAGRESATDPAAKRWAGWGTALKPASEPILVARKPPAGTVAQTVLAHGTGAINVDACRVTAGQDYRDKCASVVGLGSNRNGDAYGEWTGVHEDSAHAAGRWPSNVVFTHAATPDGGDACVDGCVEGCPVAELDAQSGNIPASARIARRDYATSRGTYSDGLDMAEGHVLGFTDSGGASRFFPVFRYQAKANAAERPKVDGRGFPTVKPLALMRWLVRLVTPPGGLVLEPFAGSGTTVEAALLEGFRCIAIERDAETLPFIDARIRRSIRPWQPHADEVVPEGAPLTLFGGEVA